MENELNPITREEMFLAKAAGQNVNAPKPITRIERFLQKMIERISLIGGGIAVTGATVGQTVKISAVDKNGVPTAWEPVEFPSGGGGSGEWKLLVNNTVTEECIGVKFDTTDDGEPFKGYRELIILVDVYGNSGGYTSPISVQFNTNTGRNKYGTNANGFSSEKNEYHRTITRYIRTEYGIFPDLIFGPQNHTNVTYNMLFNVNNAYAFELPISAQNTHMTDTVKLSNDTEFNFVMVTGHQAVLGAGTIIRVYGKK